MPHSIRLRESVCRIREALGYRACWSALALAPGLAAAGPSGGDVVAGSAAIVNPDANTTVITQTSSKAIIDWRSFSIGEQEFVRFAQPGRSAIALNRVVGGNASSILGSLSANGQVFLVNPHGIYFGPGARVDVGGLVASVFDIRNEDFLAGRYRFTRSASSPAGTAVVNDGVIEARENGYVVLAGDYSVNRGVIQARLGTVVLGSGSRVTLDLEGDGLVSFAVDEAALTALAAVENTGALYADGGRVVMTAKVAAGLVATAVNNAGVVRANGIVAANGEIYLTGEGGGITQSGTLVADTAAPEGAGRIEVRSTADVTLEPGSRISASGARGGVHGGGEVRIVAEGTLDLRPGSEVRADGGVDGGDGGFVEVSGRTGLALRGAVTGRARAPGYANGALLIDPLKVVIQSGASGGLPPELTSDGSLSAGERPGEVLFIDPADLAAFGSGFSDVTLAATSDVDVSDAIGTGTARFQHDLTLRADKDVNVNADIFLGANALTLAADADGDGSGDVTIRPGLGFPVTVDSEGGINVSGVDFTVSAGNGKSVTVRAGTDVTVGVTRDMKVSAGNARADASDDSTVVADASALVTAGRDVRLTVGRNLLVLGGSANADASGSSADQTNVATAIANAEIRAGRDIVTVTPIGGRLRVEAASDEVFPDASNEGTNTATASGNARLVAVRDVDLTVAQGALVQGGDTATADAGSNFFGGNGSHDNVATGNANASISAGNDLTLRVTAGGLTIAAGTDASADVDGSRGPDTARINTNATLEAGHDLTLVTRDTIDIEGGTTGSAEADNAVGDPNLAEINSNALVVAGHDLSITVTAGRLNLLGGSYNEASATDNGPSVARINANATVAAGNDVTINADLGVNLRGGDINNATASEGTRGADLAEVNARATIAAGNRLGVMVQNGGLLVDAGSNAVASAQDSGDVTAQTNVNAELLAGQDLLVTLSGGGLTVRGGDDADANGSGSDTTGARGIGIVDANGVVAAGRDLIVALGGNALTVAAGARNEADVDDFFSGGGAVFASATGNANAVVTAGRNVTVNGASTVTVSGGNNTVADYQDRGAGGALQALANANARIGSRNPFAASIAGGGPTVNLPPLTLTFNPTANVTVNAANGISLNGGTATAGAQNGRTSGGTGANSMQAFARAGVYAANGLALNAGSGPLTLDGGTATTVGPGTHAANADAAVAGGIVSLVTGGDLLNGPATIDADALSIVANAVDMPNTAINLTGAATLLGLGDPVLTRTVEAIDARVPAGAFTDPHLLIDVAGSFDLGSLTLGGAFPYVVFKTDSPAYTLGALATPGLVPDAGAAVKASDILFQLTAHTPGAAFAVTQSPSGSLFNLENFLGLPPPQAALGTNIAFGSSRHQGDITAGAPGQGLGIAASENVLFLTRGNVTAYGATGPGGVAYDAGGDVTFAGPHAVDRLSAVALGDVDVSGRTVVAARLANLVAAGPASDLLLGGTSITAGVAGIPGSLIIAAGHDVTDGTGSSLPTALASGPLPTTTHLTADGMFIEAGHDVVGPRTRFTVGDGGVPGLVGEGAVNAVLNAAGITGSDPDPNAFFFAGDKLALGDLDLVRNGNPATHVVFQASEIHANVRPDASPDIRVQWLPADLSLPIGVIESGTPAACAVPGSCGLVLTNADHFSRFPGTTHVIGSTLLAGDIFIDPVTMGASGSQNVLFASRGRIRGVRNVDTTGRIIFLGTAFGAGAPLTPGDVAVRLRNDDRKKKKQRDVLVIEAEADGSGGLTTLECV